MKKYYIASDKTAAKYNPIYSIWEVNMTWPRSKDQDTYGMANGIYKTEHLTEFFKFKVGASTGNRQKWRFRDNLWECAALLIIMLLNDELYPTKNMLKLWFRKL